MYVLDISQKLRSNFHLEVQTTKQLIRKATLKLQSCEAILIDARLRAVYLFPLFFFRFSEVSACARECRAAKCQGARRQKRGLQTARSPLTQWLMQLGLLKKSQYTLLNDRNIIEPYLLLDQRILWLSSFNSARKRQNSVIKIPF